MKSLRQVFKKNKLKFVHQLESIDCGPACLAMVANFYKLKYSLKEIKSLCSVTRMGVSVQDIVNGSKKMGLIPHAIKVTPEQLEELPLPAILFWKQDHFVVLHEIKKTKKKTTYFLADPGYGQITTEREILINEWMGANDKGVAIAFELNEGHVHPAPKISKAGVFGNKSVLLDQVWDFIKKRKSKYILASTLLLLGLVTNWFMPIIFRKILDEGIMNKSLQIVWMLLGVQLVLFLSNFISDYISHWTITKANFYLSNNLKENFLRKLMKLPVSYFDTRLNTDTLQRLSDQEKMKDFVTWKGLDLLINSLNIIVFSVMLLFINKLVFIIYLALSILSIIWVSFFLKLRAIIEYSLFLRQSENSNNLYEFIMNMPEIKINNAQENIITKIIAVQNKLNTLELRSLFLNMWQVVGVGFLSKLKEIATIALCAYLIINGNMTIGTLLGITYILGQLTGPIHNLITFIKNAQDASISQKRVSDVYSEKNENNDQMELIPELIHSFSVDNVSFKYPGSFNPFVLNNVSFDIPIDKITAIVGTSGSGKTTLLKLLLSYYSPDKGHISLNGEDLYRFHKERWRDECAVVAQDGYIFSGTIGYNISFSDTNPDIEKIKAAAKIACIDSFIESLPMAYNTKTGNVGIQLSGGQKQRILIARAVYRNPKFLFFDEATSSLDANSEKLIMDNLNDFFKGKTVVVIAHRLSTVKNADQIIVLEKGEIVETGTHQLLTQTKGNYFELVKNQLELGN
jgi:ATP-binding cassette subfamily B protein